MESYASTVLLLTALVLPVLVFLLVRPRSRSGVFVAAVVAVAAGWAFNVAYVVAAEAIAADTLPGDADGNLAIAVAYGWACPLVLVLAAWLVRRFATRRAGRDTPSGAALLRDAA